METMAALLIVGVIALGAAVVASVTWRRAADERQSVRHHQHTLETLRHVAQRHDQPSDLPGRDRRTALRPRVVPPWTRQSGAPSQVAPPRPGRPPSGPGPAGWMPGAHARRRALAAAGLVVVVGAVAAALSGGSVPRPRTASAGGQRPAPVPAGRTTTSASTGPVTPVAATASTATYVASGARFTVVLRAAGPCWVMASDTVTGAVVWTGTVPAGGTQALLASDPLAVRLGAPESVTVLMDGLPVRFPPTISAPFTMTFQSGLSHPS